MKPPAFQFYADDFLAGTFTFTNEQRGLYITLLCLQWSQGSVSEATVTALAGSMPSGSIAVVRAKFVPDEVDGALRNQRLEVERQKQAQFRAKCSEAGRRSVEGRLKEPSRLVEGGGQPKGNSPSPSPISNLLIEDKRRFAPPALDEVKQFASEIGMAEAEAVLCWNYYEANGWKVGRNPMKSWPAAVRGWHGRAGSFTKAQPASSATLSPAARAFALSKELERVEIALKDLDRQAYEPSGLSQDERVKRKELRAKREELRKELNL